MLSLLKVDINFILLAVEIHSFLYYNHRYENCGRLADFQKARSVLKT